MAKRLLRLALVAALLWCAAPASPARAAEPFELYTKLQTIALEKWDADGMFHVVIVDLVIVMPPGAKEVNKNVFERIKRALDAYSYEEFMKANPGPLIKSVAMEIIRKEPNGELAKEVLLARLLFR